MKLNPITRSLVVVALAAATVAACKLAPVAKIGAGAGVIMSFPRIAGDYVLWEFLEAGEKEKTKLPADTEMLRAEFRSTAHRKVPPEPLRCSIVLAGAEKRSIHRPQICLTAQGWTIRSNEVVPVKLEDGRVFHVMDLSLSRDQAVSEDEVLTMRAHYMYWFVGKDTTTPSSLKRILLTAWDNLIRNVNHRWAYVSVMSVVSENLREGGKSSADTREEMIKFIRTVAPSFMKPEVLGGGG